MKQLVIACGIFRQEINALVEKGELDAEVVYLNKLLHMEPDKLYKALKVTLEKYADRKPIVVYGDVCAGFNNEIPDMVKEFGTVKVDCLNCIDCLLGGCGKLLEIDPDHRYFYITPEFLEFFEERSGEKNRDLSNEFSMLDGVILVDSTGDLDQHKPRIDEFCSRTGLSVVKRIDTGLSGVKKGLEEAMKNLV